MRTRQPTPVAGMTFRAALWSRLAAIAIAMLGVGCSVDATGIFVTLDIRAGVVAKRIDVEDLPEEIRTAVPRPFDLAEVRPLDAVERDYILAVLDRNQGNRARTASDLGIGTATLYRKLKEFGTDAPR